jgi:hypothetical protein
MATSDSSIGSKADYNLVLEILFGKQLRKMERNTMHSLINNIVCNPAKQMTTGAL